MTRSNFIRQADISDLPHLVRLEREGFVDDFYERQQLRYYLNRPTHFTILLHEREGAVTGAAIMGWRKRTRVGHLYSIVTEPGARGRGVGSLLLEACEQEAVAKGRDRLFLQVRSKNPAVAFYKRRGYAVIRTEKDYYENDDAIEMIKRLASNLPGG